MHPGLAGKVFGFYVSLSSFVLGSPHYREVGVQSRQWCCILEVRGAPDCVVAP